MSNKKSIPTKKERGFMLLGLILGALLGTLGNIAVSAHFKLFNPSGIILFVVYFLSLGGLIVLIIWMFLFVRKLLK